MKDKIKKYIDGLFSDIHETKQLRELKEEIGANLLEKINDFIKLGNSEEDAFKKAVSSLGDMEELAASLRKVSEDKVKTNPFENPPLDRKHIFGYAGASAVLLFGIMAAGIMYLQERGLFIALATLTPFLLITVPVFVYLGLTQESSHEYGMKSRRAAAYALTSEVLLFGLLAAGIMYFQRNELFIVLSTAMPFTVISLAAFIYLGLTEKSRIKMNSAWQKQWVEYYANPQAMMVRGNISGALWIFAVAAFFVVGFTQGWKYSWIVFVAATGVEVLIEAFFASKRKGS